MDERGEGAWQPAEGGTADDRRNPADAAARAGALDSPGGVLPAKSAAAEDVCRLSRCALRWVVGADVRAADGGTPRRTTRSQWGGTGDGGLDSVICRQSPGFC